MLQEADWNVFDIPEDMWKQMGDSSKEAREALEDLPRKHLVQRRLRTPIWFEEEKKKWSEDLQKAIQTERTFESPFGDQRELIFREAKLKKEFSKAEERVKEWKRHISKWYFDNANNKPSFDRIKGYYQRSKEELRIEQNELFEERTRREESLKFAAMDLEKTQAKLKKNREMMDALVADVKVLRKRWHKVQQDQMKEYRELGLSTEDLEPRVPISRKAPKGPTTQASAAGSSEPSIHPSSEIPKELGSMDSTRKGKKTEKRALSAHYPKVHQKVEFRAQGDPDA
jgi:hypothetical protein